MYVHQVMNPHIAVSEKKATLYDVSSFFVDRELNGVVIVDQDKIPCGIITKSNIIKAVSEKDIYRTAADCMCVHFENAHPDDMIEDLDLHKYEYVVVWDGENVTGMITKKNINRIYKKSVHGCFIEFAQLIDHIESPIVLIDSNGWINLCNIKFSRLLDMDKGNIINKPLADILPEFVEIHSSEHDFTEQSLTIGHTSYLVSWTNIWHEEKHIGMMGFFYNLSNEVAISEQLKQTKILSLQLDAIIESSFDGIFVTDGEGRVLRVNKAYERITGIKAHEVVGRTMQSLVREGFYNESVTLKVLKSRREITIIQHVSKMDRTIVVTGNPVFDEKQNIRLVVTNARDVTELSSLQNKLQHMKSLTSGYDDPMWSVQIDKELNEKFVLASKAMQDLKQLAKRLGRVESTILIQGESGVGKGVFAQMVHAFSNESQKPFMQVSCAAIPEHLLESELFGYSGGAFTGANRGGKQGLFELAEGGYIFLDEIGEMPMGLQAKLLRVIQEREFYRIGDPATPVKVNVRIITATNRNLEEMVTKKTFRKDLFYRLNVVPVSIPPLRERRDGIMKKIQAFMKKCNTKYGWSKQIDYEVIQALVNYEWPGNVRELENTIERMAVMSDGDIIKYHDLPSNIQSSKEHYNFRNKSLKSMVCDVEKSAIQDALNTYKSTRKAAESLGVNQSTIVRKAKLYGLDSRTATDA